MTYMAAEPVFDISPEINELMALKFSKQHWELKYYHVYTILYR